MQSRGVNCSRYRDFEYHDSSGTLPHLGRAKLNEIKGLDECDTLKVRCKEIPERVTFKHVFVPAPHDLETILVVLKRRLVVQGS